MNRLSRKEQAAIIRALVEGNSLRSTTRITGHSINTVSKLLVELGAAAEAFLYDNLRDLPATRIECDEIWAFCYAKSRNVPDEHKGEWGYGDVWTWVALDPDTKLVCTWLVGKREGGEAQTFLLDLAGRLRNRVQITTDGHKPYIQAVEAAFGKDVDYAMLMKVYGTDPNEERRFSPPVVLDETVFVMQGNPDPTKISTSYVERQNLTMRMGMRRFTRLTNGFSKKVDNHAASVALHFMYMNYGRPHKSLANPYQRTPAMAAGLADHIWTCEEIAALLV
ncbi:MAG TPA: IS1 family transposase [Acidimicrobiales bacterium]|nr:IS1 family transposase [Acidimicrobiales bacterium]